MDILNKIKQIQALAETGLHYSHNEFELNRNRDISNLSLDILSGLSEIPVEQLKTAMIENNGYKTPKVDVRAVVFNDQNEILMVREKIDGLWSLPGGWADIGYTPSETAVKESHEEAGAEVEPLRLLAVLDKRCHNHPPDLYYIYKIFIECRFKGWTGRDHLETTDAGFFSAGNLPALSTPRNTSGQMEMLFDFHNGKRVEPVFD